MRRLVDVAGRLARLTANRPKRPAFRNPNSRRCRSRDPAPPLRDRIAGGSRAAARSPLAYNTYAMCYWLRARSEAARLPVLAWVPSGRELSRGGSELARAWRSRPSLAGLAHSGNTLKGRSRPRSRLRRRDRSTASHALRKLSCSASLSWAVLRAEPVNPVGEPLALGGPAYQAKASHGSHSGSRVERVRIHVKCPRVCFVLPSKANPI